MTYEQSLPSELGRDENLEERLASEDLDPDAKLIIVLKVVEG